MIIAKEVRDDIVRKLTLLAATLPAYSDAGIRTVYASGTFIIRCIPTERAVLAVAAKYRKAGDLRTRQPRRTGVDTLPMLSVRDVDRRYADDEDHAAFKLLVTER